MVIYMENHTFNNVLGKLCVDDHRCEGTTTGQLSDGTTIPLTQATDVSPAIGHGTAAATNAINGGAMDGFDTVLHCHKSDGYASVSLGTTLTRSPTSRLSPARS